MYATDPACAHIQFGGEVCDIFTYFHLNSSVTNRLHNFMAALYIEFFLNFLGKFSLEKKKKKCELSPFWSSPPPPKKCET